MLSLPQCNLVTATLSCGSAVELRMSGNGTIASNVDCTRIRPMGSSHSESTVMVLFFFVVVRKKRILSSAERGLVLVEILWQTELKT